MAIQLYNITENLNTLRMTAMQITWLARECEDTYYKMMSKINDLSETWQAIDAQGYCNKLGNYRAEITEMNEEVDRFANFLNQTVVSYEDVQSDYIKILRDINQQ